MKKQLRVLVILLAILMLAACTPAEPVEADPTSDPVVSDPPATGDPEPVLENAERYGGDFVQSTALVSNTLDPHYSNGLMGSYQWMQYVYETPIVTSDTGEIFPLLCSYEYDEAALTLTLTMMPDRFFSDGTPVTIEDVDASIQRASACYANFAAAFGDILVNTEISGDSVTYTFSSFNPNTLFQMGDVRGPVYVTKKTILDDAGAEMMTDVSTVIGSGCYTLTKYEPDTVYELTKNPDYIPVMNDATGPAGPRYGYFDTYTMYVNTDTASVTAAMIAGEYHFGNVISDMAPFADEIGLKRVALQNLWTPAIFFNLNTEYNGDSIVQNKDFRKAVRAAFDCEAIMLSVTAGDRERFTLEPSPMAPDSIYYNPIFGETEWNVHDQALVDQYLAAAGYNGEKIVWLCAQSSSFYNAAVVGIEQLNNAGINCEMMLVDTGAHSALRNAPDSGHDIGAWESQKGTTVPSGVGSFIRGTSAGWWENEEKTRLLDILSTTPAGSEASIAAYNDLCELYVEEVPWIAFGNMATIRYAVPNLELNYEGVISYYWNSYFTEE